LGGKEAIQTGRRKNQKKKLLERLDKSKALLILKSLSSRRENEGGQGGVHGDRPVNRGKSSLPLRSVVRAIKNSIEGKGENTTAKKVPPETASLPEEGGIRM